MVSMVVDVAERERSGFGVYLQELIDRRPGLNPQKLAHYTGISPNSLSVWLRGTYTPRPDSLAKLAPILKVSYDDLMRAAGHLPPSVASASTAGGERPDTDREADARRDDAMPTSRDEAMELLARLAGVPIPRRIPVQESVHAGAGGIEGQFVYELPEWHGRRIVVITVRGRCMEPEIRPGDRAVVDLDQEPEDDDLVVVEVGDEVMIRRYDERTDSLLAQDGSPPIAMDDASVIATVIEVTYKPRRKRRSA